MATFPFLNFPPSASLSAAVAMLSRLATIDADLLSLTFFWGARSEKGELRLIGLLGSKTPLEDLMKLIAAVADPVDSRSANAVNSSRVSAPAAASQAKASRDLFLWSRRGTGKAGRHRWEGGVGC